MATVASAVALALLVSVAGLNMEALQSSSLRFDVEGAKNRPVSKVITLLKDMLKQLEKEADEDEDIYDKLACWCETNDKEKTKAIADGEAAIEDLTSKIEELTATSARLGTEIGHLKDEVEKFTEALEQATAIRQKELAEFNGEEKDLLQSITALKAAIVVLSKHHPESLLQVSERTVSQSHFVKVASNLDRAMLKHASLLQSALTPKQRRVVVSFLQQPQDFFDAEPTFKQSYAPQSGEIFGILKQMKETFEANLAASQKDEMAAQKAYEDLKATKEEEIAAATDSIDKKTQELADTDEKLATSKQDVEDTREKLAADEEFLSMLKEKCQMTDQEWEERQKTRQLEMEAVSKALAILSGDDAHDTFTRTFNPEFLQAKAETSRMSAQRLQASKLLRSVATRLSIPRLSAMAMRIRLDAFTKVKAAIDEMIAQLMKEKEDEIKHKDFCVDEFNKNQQQTEKKEREKTDLETKIEDLNLTLKTLTEEIEQLKAEISEMQVQLKTAGEDREKENKDFQLTVTDQRATQKLLQAALEVLKGFYSKTERAVELAQQEPAGPPPPPGFKAYTKNAASGGVMGMIQQIIQDAKAMEAEALRAEEDAQKAYEDFVKETNTCIEEAGKSIVEKSELKAKAEGELTEAEEAHDDVVVELEQLANYKAQLHASCDFIMKNFEIRQAARDEEIEALKQAKAILSGAKFDSFIQYGR